MQKSGQVRRKLNLWLFSVTASAVIGLYSCKDHNQRAEIKTLDSIASGETNLKDNQCSGSYKALINPASQIIFDILDPQKISAENKTKIQSAVTAYFTAIPEPMQKLFLDFGGTVLISTRVDELCSGSRSFQALDAQAQEKTEGCFAFATDPKNIKPAILTLIQSPNKTQNIQYYGPQLFGYLYAQFYSRVGEPSSPKRLFDINQTESTVMVSQKERVANAFLEDMLKSKTFNFDVLTKILGTNARSELGSDQKIPPLDRLTFSGATSDKTKRKAQVLDYFFANAFQSMHCNDHSKEVALKFFKNSHDVFASVDDAILDFSAKLSGSVSSRDTANSKKQATEKKQTVAASGKSEFSLGGGNPMDMLSMLMPALGGGGQGAAGGIQSLLGGLTGGAGGGGGIADLFKKFSGGLGGGGGLPGIDKLLAGGGGALSGALSGMYSQLSGGGCQGGSCPGGSCNGSCSGGACSSCANGNCGGCTGGCSCG